MVEKASNWNQWTALGGIVAKQLGMIDDAQIARICRIQGFLIAAQKAGIAISREEEAQIFNATPEQMQTIAQAKGIDGARIDEETAGIGLNSRVPDGIPVFMKIAGMAKDFKTDQPILPKTKSGVTLAAQAAARMAEAVDQMESGDIKQTLEGALKPRPWIDNGIEKEGEQKYVVAAQATQQLAEIFSAGLASRPDLADNQEVRKAMMAFQLYASQTLKRAGNELQEMGLPDAGKQIKDSRDSLHFAWDKIKSWLSLSIFSEFANTSALTSDIEKGLKKLNLTLSKEQQEMISNRLAQAKGMEHKGIPFPPMLRAQHSINAASWAQRAAASKGNGMGHGL